MVRVEHPSLFKFHLSQQTLDSCLVQKAIQLEVAVAWGEILREPLKRKIEENSQASVSLVDWLIPRCHSTWGGGWWWAPCRPPPSSGSAFSRSASWPTSGSTRSARWCSAGGLETAVVTFYIKTHFHVALKCDSLRRRISAISLVLYLQSRCFFFGPMISSVVALHTAFARPWNTKVWRAILWGLVTL